MAGVKRVGSPANSFLENPKKEKTAKDEEFLQTPDAKGDEKIDSNSAIQLVTDVSAKTIDRDPLEAGTGSP